MTKYTLCVLSLLSLFSSFIFFRHTNRRHDSIPSRVVDSYNRWKHKHQKLYASNSENHHRLRVFYEQTLFIEEANTDYDKMARESGVILTGPMFEMNQFGDLSSEEFSVRYTGGRPSEDIDRDPINSIDQTSGSHDTNSHTNIPGQDEAYRVIIRDQGRCGGCWAFAAIASLEKFYFDKFGTRIELSQQELIDCDGYSMGCAGGSSERAFYYVTVFGITKLSDYPYLSDQSYCKRDKEKSVNVTSFESIGNIYYNHSTAVSFTSKGIHPTITLYSSGKFRYVSNSPDVLDARMTSECGMVYDHVLNIVEARDDGTLRLYNSWGEKWGEKGFKTIRVCADDNVWGNGARLAHPYGSV